MSISIHNDQTLSLYINTLYKDFVFVFVWIWQKIRRWDAIAYFQYIRKNIARFYMLKGDWSKGGKMQFCPTIERILIVRRWPRVGIMGFGFLIGSYLRDLAQLGIQSSNCSLGTCQHLSLSLILSIDFISHKQVSTLIIFFIASKLFLLFCYWNIWIYIL